ncbi:hypothetical protein ACTFIW_011123 [Dictyostelium discoideum]
MNNKIENEHDIDYRELEKKNLKSIKEIAQSYSISTTKLKKAEIIEKIKSIVKRKREYEEEQKQKENVNSFNKIIKLTITDNIEPTEILFWKLFRNKIIYKKIFSFMDKQYSITYDSMSSITQLIDSNQFGIIKEKVYRNCRYLHYNTNQNSIKTNKDIQYLVKLFSTINDDDDDDDNDDDYGFYRNFLNQDNGYYNSTYSVVCALILSKKLQVFKLFVNEFNYQPTKTDLLYSIINGSNKFIKYILESNSSNSFLLVDKDYSEAIYDYRVTQKDSFYKGLLYYLNYIGNGNYKRNQYLQLLFSHTTTTNGSYKAYFEINEKSKLKTLITTARLILKLKTPPPPPIKYEKKDSDVIDEEIDNFIKKINKVNLKSLLDDPTNFNNNDNSNNNEIKNFIKKLLKLYQSTFNCKISKVLYFCYFHEESNDDYKTIYLCTKIGYQYDLIEIALVIQLTPYLYEINNFKFLNWFLTIVKKYNNPSSSKTIKTNIKNLVFAFMEYITSNSKLQILEYIHQNFDFLLKRDLYGGILNTIDLKSFLASSLQRGTIKITNFLSHFITITKK